jgi:hypothetical protein
VLVVNDLILMEESRESSTLDFAPKEEKAEPVSAADVLDRPVGWRWALALGALYSTAFLYGLDTTISADVQPAIVSSFGSIGKIAWIGAGFPLGSIAVILPLGVAYGMFNIKVSRLHQ